MFGFLKDKLPIYCNLHKLENMINIRKMKCIFKDKNGSVDLSGVAKRAFIMSV